MKNIWEELPKPIFALAPMEDVTDTVFRQILLKNCHSREGENLAPFNASQTTNLPTTHYPLQPVLFTEFISTEDIVHHYSKIPDQKLKLSSIEKPLIVQIWGNKPESFYQAAKQLAGMDFDGIDINMGCPDRNVMKQCGGAGMIKDPTLAKEVIQATKEGAPHFPISVKTRLGINSIEVESWIGLLLDQNLAALTIHARTAAEMSKVPAHWEEFGKVVQLKNEKQKPTIILGNGDIESLQQGRELREKYGIDGIMIGRGIFKNFWAFNESNTPETVSPEEKIKILEEHVHLFVETWGDTKNFHTLRKYFKIYMTHFPGAKEILNNLMQTENEEEIKNILSKFSTHYPLIPTP